MLQPFTRGIWLSSQPQRIVGMQLTSTMAVLLLPDQKLLLYSPVEMTAERRAAVEALGTVAHLYAPNYFITCTSESGPPHFRRRACMHRAEWPKSVRTFA